MSCFLILFDKSSSWRHKRVSGGNWLLRFCYILVYCWLPGKACTCCIVEQLLCLNHIHITKASKSFDAILMLNFIRSIALMLHFIYFLRAIELILLLPKTRHCYYLQWSFSLLSHYVPTYRHVKTQNVISSRGSRFRHTSTVAATNCCSEIPQHLPQGVSDHFIFFFFLLFFISVLDVLGCIL